MKAETVSLEEEVAMNQEKNKQTYTRVEGIVDHMIELYEQAEKSIRTGKDHREVIQGLNQQLLTLRPLKTVREHFVHYYRKLSSLIRRIQNTTKNTNGALSRYSRRKDSNGTAVQQLSILNNNKFNRYFDQFITQDVEKKALERLIVEHFLRQGLWDCANVWSRTAAQIDPNKLFYECHKLRVKIAKGEFEQAILWCQTERLYESKDNLLEYELMKAQVISLLQRGQSRKALNYVAKQVKKFMPACRTEIEKLIGYIMFKQKKFWGEAIQSMENLYNYCNNRYAEFSFTQQKCENLAQLFMREYLRHNKLSQFNVIKIVYNCSKKISQEYQRLMSLTWHFDSKQKKYDGLLPFSISLEKQYQYHSLFLCPVTKEVHTSGQPSVLLACGHLISQQAQERIVLESRNRRRVRCPICQKQIQPQQSISVEF